MIADEANEIIVSAVSIFEIALKRGVDRGDLPLRLLTYDKTVACYSDTVICFG